jgi:hypothetical protein
VLVAHRAAPDVRVAFVSDTVFNLPGAQPASIYNLLWQRELTASMFNFTGAMLNPKKRPSPPLVSDWTAGTIGAKANRCFFALGYNLLYAYGEPAR